MVMLPFKYWSTSVFMIAVLMPVLLIALYPLFLSVYTLLPGIACRPLVTMSACI